MKVILAGVGFIGQAVLEKCLQESSITSIVVLSRRERPDIAALDKRIKVLVLHDFNRYSFSQIQELSGATICFWYA
jgi:saccharopine dehydrogenase-like NADP-dependent oxidoreductase